MYQVSQHIISKYRVFVGNCYDLTKYFGVIWVASPKDDKRTCWIHLKQDTHSHSIHLWRNIRSWDTPAYFLFFFLKSPKSEPKILQTGPRITDRESSLETFKCWTRLLPPRNWIPYHHAKRDPGRCARRLVFSFGGSERLVLYCCYTYLVLWCSVHFQLCDCKQD